MATTHRDIHLTVSSTDYFLVPAEDEHENRKIIWANRPWQPHDPKQPFRVALFPWTGGLGPNRFDGAPVYAKANADTTVPGQLLHPPLLVNAPLASITGNVLAIAEYSSTQVFIAGADPDSYYFNPSNNTVTLSTIGFNVTHLSLFNGELIAAGGAAQKIAKYDGSWTTASDNTFANAIGVVDDKLWRAVNNLVSNCEDTPLTLANWVPAAGSEYEVGDTSYDVNTILDYQGTIWCGKADGMYAADPTFRFHNQTPQIKARPHTDNCKGAFVAHGSIWVPSSSGLYRIRWGSSILYGPELAHRPSFRPWVRAGIEFGGDIFLLCTDEGGTENTVIIRMVRSVEDVNQYTYHEWCRLGNTTTGLAIAVTTGGTQPKLLIAHGTDLKYIDLGRGGGRWDTDPNYNFGTAMVLETGDIRPASDLSMVSMLIGVEVLLDYSAAGESLTMAVSTDKGTFNTLWADGEAPALSAIELTTNYQSIRRYSNVAALQTGQFHNIRFTSTLTSAAGTNRPEIIEAWAFGWIRPKMTDMVTIAIDANEQGWIGLGKRTGITTEEIVRLFRSWADSATLVTMVLEAYDEGKTNRFLVMDVVTEDTDELPGYGIASAVTKEITVTLMRVNFNTDYAAS